MGKNSYLGGSTIIHTGSRLFSRDKKKSRLVNAEKDFLLRCVRADLVGKSYPLVYSEPEKLQAIVEKAGGVSSWLKNHPDFDKIRARELRKQEKRSVEAEQQKQRKAVVKKQQSENTEIRKKRELAYLKDFIWSQIVGREAPKSKPKGFDKAYPTVNHLSEWAKSHEKYEEVSKEMLSKRKKQLERIENSKINNVEVVIKKSRRSKTIKHEEK